MELTSSNVIRDIQKLLQLIQADMNKMFIQMNNLFESVKSIKKNFIIKTIKRE